MPINLQASQEAKTKAALANDPFLQPMQGKTPEEIKNLIALRGLNPQQLLETIQTLTIAVTHLLK